MNGRWFLNEISSKDVRIVYKSIPERKLRKMVKEKIYYRYRFFRILALNHSKLFFFLNY